MAMQVNEGGGRAVAGESVLLLVPIHIFPWNIHIFPQESIFSLEMFSPESMKSNPKFFSSLKTKGDA